MDAIIDQSRDDLAEARERLKAVRASLEGLDDARDAIARLERMEAELERLERAIADQAVASV